jgi:hypothetical protein
METMDAVHAYHAMFRFLEKYYELTGSGDIGALLGSMALLDDGKPADPAMWGEWLEVISATNPVRAKA